MADSYSIIMEEEALFELLDNRLIKYFVELKTPVSRGAVQLAMSRIVHGTIRKHKKKKEDEDAIAKRYYPRMFKTIEKINDVCMKEKTDKQLFADMTATIESLYTNFRYFASYYAELCTRKKIAPDVFIPKKDALFSAYNTLNDTCLALMKELKDEE